MKKSDLKTGMLVETRDENIYMIINDWFYAESAHNRLEYYKDDLTNIDFERLDIIKVSEVLNGPLLRPMHWTKETLENNLLWQREETPEYVEILSSSTYEGEYYGKILKVDKSREIYPNGALNAFNKNGLSLHFYGSEIKPSTKEAYDKQDAIPEKTMQELIDELGYEFKIKK